LWWWCGGGTDIIPLDIIPPDKIPPDKSPPGNKPPQARTKSPLYGLMELTLIANKVSIFTLSIAIICYIVPRKVSRKEYNYNKVRVFI